MSERARVWPGEHVLHPVFLGSVLILALNDHVFKVHMGGWWTGKLSDLVGLIFFPLLLQALWEVGLWMLGRFRGHRNDVLLVAAVATGCFFSWVQLSTQGAAAYRWLWGMMQAVPRWIGTGHWQLVPVRVWSDPWDLLALPALGVACWVGWSR